MRSFLGDITNRSAEDGATEANLSPASGQMDVDWEKRKNTPVTAPRLKKKVCSKASPETVQHAFANGND